MYYYLFPFILTLILMWPFVSVASQQLAPPLMLAKVYTENVLIEHYWVSEKLDGVRAYWDGSNLITRSGRLISVPEWFVSDFPDVPVDGEIWLGRGRFDDVSGLIRSVGADDPLWREVVFKAFDLPSSLGTYEVRMAQLRLHIVKSNVPWLQSVEHHQFSSQEQVDAFLSTVVNGGGEGLMLNHTNALYLPKRTDAILKLKPKWDDEAQVVGFSQGKGKYEGLMGSLVVRMKDGREFKIGSGFSDSDRKQPPVKGSWITFEYSGLTSTGLPRFARYLRPYSSI